MAKQKLKQRHIKVTSTTSLLSLTQNVTSFRELAEKSGAIFPGCVSFTRYACKSSANRTQRKKAPWFLGSFELASGVLIWKASQAVVFMARKLYIFVPAGRLKTDAQRPAKWVGGFTANYSYLGDCQARLLGLGNNFTPKRLPAWVHASASNAKYIKGGASRSDRNFRGWG